MSGSGVLAGIGRLEREGHRLTPGSELDAGVRKQSDQFATPLEAQDAIQGLSKADHAKLMIIAKSFARLPSIRSRVDAGDLLHDAIVKTIDGTRRWNRRVSIVRHLDRVMESDAGHAASKARRNEPLEEREAELAAPSDYSQMLAREQLEEVLRMIEGDEQALEVLRLKGDGLTASEIRASMKMSDMEYDTVGRRIRRLRERLSRGGD
jgi:DNA-binding transcriptional ArsR family regulator